MGKPDPYQSWSGAPKHWVEIPTQRQAPPSEIRAVPTGGRGPRPAPVRYAPTRPAAPSRRRDTAAGLWVALWVALAVAVIALGGPGASVAALDGPAQGAVTLP